MNKSDLKAFKICILLALLMVFGFKSSVQHSNTDTTKILQVIRLNFSINNLSIRPKIPTFNKFQNDFRFGNRFLTSTFQDFTEDEFTATSFYSGFMVNFIFQNNVFEKDTNHDRNYFSVAFESGHTDNELYRFMSSDTTRPMSLS
ncbi:MAG: hypothetical protein NWS46_02025 [Cyclobacteriaceae bacterium]|nr:hypothetical protein [Cyclobacteriaceae bacterium]